MVANFLFKQNSHNKVCIVAYFGVFNMEVAAANFLSSSIFRWFQKFWKICAALSLRKYFHTFQCI